MDATRSSANTNSLVGNGEASLDPRTSPAPAKQGSNEAPAENLNQPLTDHDVLDSRASLVSRSSQKLSSVSSSSSPSNSSSSSSSSWSVSPDDKVKPNPSSSGREYRPFESEESNLRDDPSLGEYQRSTAEQEQPPLPDISKLPNSTSAAATDTASDPTPTTVPADQERQILLLMLLGQVCALHDPTPRTFTAHVLEFFERGILDRQSIMFLYKLGLVPYEIIPQSSMTATTAAPTSARLHPQLLLTAGPHNTDESSDQKHPTTTISDHEQQLQELALVAGIPPSRLQHAQRMAEVSAIRTSLEQHERQLQQQQRRTNVAASLVHGETHAGATIVPPSQPVSPSGGDVGSSSFAAEHHPLSFSRFQREFEQVRLLSSGAFGTVYQATNKMDGREYAIKRVEFVARGYAQESVHRVVREVHCLAMCDHINVVRYYTSWLEPSWMAGSTATTSTSPPLALIEDDNNDDASSVDTHGSYDPTTNNPGALHHYDDLQAFMKTTSSLPSRRRRRSPHRHARRPSWDDSIYSRRLDGTRDEESSAWTVDYYYGRADEHEENYHDARSRSRGRRFRGRKGKEPQQQSQYRYQISLFIQMQLCKTVTLADWIRERNENGTDIATRLEVASLIFSQVSGGLAHVHHKGIIHRDLKPANIFVSHEADGLNFKIGDFGLSKLIRSTTLHNRSMNQRGGSAKLLQSVHDVEQDGSHFVVPPDEPSGDDVPHNQYREPLTAGVGTASYASPEQVSSRSYGSSADIFSLGLILLELLCSFSTEHERLFVFRNCRQHRTLPDELHPYPVVEQTILSCTEPIPSKRPSAHNLSTLDLRSGTTRATEQDQVQLLIRRLQEKDEEIEYYKQQLEEKQRIIDTLLQDADRRKNGSPSKIFHFSGTSGCESDSNLPPSDVSSSRSSSSSDDEL